MRNCYTSKIKPTALSRLFISVSKTKESKVKYILHYANFIDQLSSTTKLCYRRATLNANRPTGHLKQYMTPNTKYIGGECNKCPHLIDVSAPHSNNVDGDFLRKTGIYRIATLDRIGFRHMGHFST